MKKYPFKFLDAYTHNDTDIFFGREEEINTLYEMVFQNSILLVYGASGTGKTSLIQCGLAGRFKSYDWLAIPVRRGNNINSSLEKSLTDAAGDTAADPLPEKNFTGLSGLINAVYVNHFKPIYLIFDQFEELYILGSTEEQQKFLHSVKEILHTRQPVKMIFSIREEYLGHLYEFEKEVPQLLRKKLRVEPMTIDKVTSVINGINDLRYSNVHVKKDEVETITKGIFERLKGKKKTLTIQLPYLQVFLDKLYIETTKDQTRQADALITKEILAGMSDIGDILQDFLQGQVNEINQKIGQKFPGTSAENIWKILSPFCTLEGTKEPISKQDLTERLPGTDRSLIDECVEAFVNRRILNYSESENLYELAHDSLAVCIASKRSDEEIALLEVQKLIKSQTSIKRDARETFSEKQLNFIEPYLSKLNLHADESKMIEESYKVVKKEKYRKKRRTIITLAGMSTALIVMVILFASSTRQKQAVMKREHEIALLLEKATQADIALKNAGENLEKERQLTQEEVANKKHLEFKDLEARILTLLNADICPIKLIDELKAIASAHRDSAVLNKRVDILRQHYPKCKF